MRRYKYNRRYNPRKRNFSYNNLTEHKVKKSKKLDMRKTEEFNFMLGRIVEELPDSIRGAIRGSIYSIASKKGAKEAKDFISKKHEEGLIDAPTQKKLMDLLYDYSKYR